MEFARREPIKLLIGVLGAHLLIHFTFQDEDIFWYMFTASALILISYTIINGNVEDQASPLKFLVFGLLSGLILYGLFFTGYFILNLLDAPWIKDVSKLYKDFAPTSIWQYIALILFVVPGEEMFWRGYVFSKLKINHNLIYSILASSALYASVHIYSDMWVLVFTAFIAGIFWNLLYQWKKSMPLLIVSHLTFDLLLFWFIPLQ